MKRFTLAALEKRVNTRAKASAKESYTRMLLDKGVWHCVKKLNEEAFETGVAAMQERKNRVKLAEVEAELGKRTAQGGHAEKARRRRKP